MWYFFYSDVNFLEEDNLAVAVEKDKICCLVKAESLRYIFLIKKSLTTKIFTKKLLDADNDTHFDAILSKELKTLSYLQLITGKNYGQIVNMINYPDKASQFPEFFRIFENHELWEKKYMKSNVSFII